MKKGHYKKVIVPETTNNITRGIINFLNSEGHIAVRINVQGQWDEQEQRWRTSGSTKGVLDINCCLFPCGRLLVVDTKHGKDKARPEQIEYAKDVIRCGGFACFAESLPWFIDWYYREVKPHLSQRNILQ